MSVAGLTACGDKVNVTQPPPDSAVTAVTVTPSSQNMNVGDKVTLVATVVAGPQQTNRNVTWTSSDATVASVDNAGVVTANKGGVATIIATSVANSAVKGNAVITVAAVVQASVTVGQINMTVCVPNGSCTSVPATLNNVHDQLDVTLNVDPGTQKISEVDLIMNCGGADTVVQKQTFSTADLAPAAEDASAPTTLSFNTAAFNPTTGAVAFKNGICTIKAKAITTQGTQVASGTQQLTLNNANTVSASFATTPGTGQKASATDAAGLLWRAGAVTVTAVPVIYTANVTVASGAVSIVNSGADHALGKNGADIAGNGGVVGTLSGLAPASGVLTAAFPLSTSATGGVGGAVVDTLSVVVTTVGSDGNPGPSLAASTSNFIRLDNRAPDITPTAPAFVAGTQHTSLSGWVGKNFSFSTDSGSITLGTAATDNQAALAAIGATSSAPGVDKVSIVTQWAPAGTSSSSSAWATFTSVSSLTETASGATDGLRIMVCDALGNCATSAQLTTFGVDLTPPSAALTTGPADKSVYNIASTLPSTVAFAETDTASTAGATPSGGAGLLVAIQGLNPSGSSGSATSCILPLDATHPCGTNVSLQGTSFSLPAGALVSGEYTMTIAAVDQAGNLAAPVTIRYYIDLLAPVISGGVSVPASIAAGTSFASSATDNMDVAAGNGYLQFNGGTQRFVESGTATPTGATFDNALVRSAAVTITLDNFYRSLSTTPGAAGVKPDVAGIRALDAAGNLAAAQQVTLPPANIANGSTIPNTGATGITAFTTTIDSAAVAATHTVVLTSTSAPVDNVNGGSPFSQVCFYYSTTQGAENGAAGPGGSAAGNLIKIGCTSALVVPPGPRSLVYTMPWTVPASLASIPGGVTVFAVGSNAGGDALISGGVALTVNAVPTP